MKVLVVGNGGREHALIWKIYQSEKVDKIYAAPGNDGMTDLAERVDIAASDIKTLADWAYEHKIDLTVVGPEKPLVKGIVNEFEKRGLRIFGPNKLAARVEGSKVFAKNILKKHNIPTAEFEVFTEPEEAMEFLKGADYPLVIKAEGLAFGKGVIIATNKAKAEEAITRIMEDKVFGDAGSRIVIENFLEGEEISVMVFTDGKNFVPLEFAQDHKAVFDGDEGPNTGGMGSYTPLPFVEEELKTRIHNEILKPALEAFNEEGLNYKGILYINMILTDMGPEVLDFNARFGDPETQVVLPRMKNDIIDIFNKTIDEELDNIKIAWDDRASVCVILTSAGYPLTFDTGKEIVGLDSINKYDNLLVFHAGTTKIGDRYYTAGGRVLGLTVLGDNLDDAISLIYEYIEEINFEDMHYRTDIGVSRRESINY
ncbi:MAG TPA: phosphoribosylamine--glycine ligase [Halanaerobiales bacterium]|nr:phosphoribosylamine--glycine ligase [Halanaerobiales bacterium]